MIVALPLNSKTPFLGVLVLENLFSGSFRSSSGSLLDMPSPGL
ncbi:MAG: hypothetical protein QOE88_1679 [Verrucomicrobiota bacterium]|nr:hypothetical protein [Verrucomicrobiota bacterium]